MTRRIPNCLSIAGVDPSGGAGVFADIKAMSAVGTYAAGVVTALTAQNTCGVTGVLPIAPTFVTEQLETLFTDVAVDAVKIGMLADPVIIHAVAESLKKHRPAWIVLDPVMVAKSGDRLLPEDALTALKTELIPLADIITPNLPEAEELLGDEIPDRRAMPAAARALYALMANPKGGVLLKGGHLSATEAASDLFYDGKTDHWLENARIATKNTHGTGCTLSSALAAYLAKTGDALTAVTAAKRYMTAAIGAADTLNVGHGHGPVAHFTEMTSPFI